MLTLEFCTWFFCTILPGTTRVLSRVAASVYILISSTSLFDVIFLGCFWFALLLLTPGELEHISIYFSVIWTLSSVFFFSYLVCLLSNISSNPFIKVWLKFSCKSIWALGVVFWGDVSIPFQRIGFIKFFCFLCQFWYFFRNMFISLGYQICLQILLHKILLLLFKLHLVSYSVSYLHLCTFYQPWQSLI